MSLQQSITEFRCQLRGVVIEPDDAAYHEARKVYNGMIDRKPRLIARCTDVADVMAADSQLLSAGFRVLRTDAISDAAGSVRWYLSSRPAVVLEG